MEFLWAVSLLHIAEGLLVNVGVNNADGQITALKTMQGTVKGDIKLTSLVEEVHNVYQSVALKA